MIIFSLMDLSISFCSLLLSCFCKWFSFLKNLIYGHVCIQAAVTVLWLEFFLSSSEEETGFIAHLLNWTEECFVGWRWLLNGKINFRNIDWWELSYLCFVSQMPADFSWILMLPLCDLPAVHSLFHQLHVEVF